MKISEILVESQQVDEGPLLNKIGAGIGKVAGTVAKGIGAVAGGVVGAGKALAKGYQAGKTTVGGAGDDIEADPATDGTAGGAVTTTPTAKTKPAAGGAPVGGPTTQPGAGAVNKSGPAGTAPAKTLAGQAKVAADKTAAATAGQDPSAAGQTMYAQVKANIDKLDKKGKQRILQLLQKSVAAPEQKPAAAGGAPAKPAADAGAGAMGAMAGQLAKGGAAEPTTMANAPVSKTNTAKPGNPNATPAAPKGNYDGNTGEPISDKGKADAASMAAYKASDKGKEMNAWNDAQDAAVAAGQKPPTLADFRASRAAQPPAQEQPAKKTRAASRVPKKAAPSQAEIDASRERIMGPTSDSIIRTRPIMAEGFSLFRKH